MANRYRGEIEAVLDGKTCTLCLTLGALAELEAAFGVGDLCALVETIATRPLGARETAIIIAAGLRGGGHDADATSVSEMRAEGGAAGFRRIVEDLLLATFGGFGKTAANPPSPRRDPNRETPRLSPGAV